MKLIAKEKLFSMHDRYYIYNDKEEIAYEIVSRMISIGDKTTIYDKDNNIIAYIEQKVMHYMPCYNVYIKNKYKFQIKKKYHLFKNNYKLSNDYKVEGSIFNLNFFILNNSGKIIAKVKRKFISISDRYEIDILDTKDLITILTIIVAITNDRVR